jgi:ABC-type transport system involved in Fe-S cluster assembly fused permease/ATPase subunit
MVALILRFYDVDMGRILLDGKDIRSYPVPLLRSLIGLVQ